tara:strand:+ start:22922 stop:23884 length:963 start_codon:yes stop_codon:yes gene_type:complete
MLEKINFLELQSVIAVSKCLNMGAAAATLQIPKSSLQKHIEAVERKLGDKLFNRAQKSGEISLTAYGQTILPKIETIVSLAGSLSITDKFSKDDHTSGEVGIMSTQTILESYVAPFVPSLLRKNPNIDIVLIQRDDVYFGQPPLNQIFIGCWDDNPETYEYIPFHTFRQKLFASKEYLKNNPPINEISDLKGHTLITLKGISETNNVLPQDSFLRKLGFTINDIKLIKVRGPRTSDILAVNGAGLLLCAPESMNLCNLGLQEVLPEIQTNDIEIFVKVHKKFLKWPLCQYMIDWIFENRDKAFKEIGVTPQKHIPLFKSS